MKSYNMHLSFLLLGVPVVTLQKPLMQEGSLKYHKGHSLSQQPENLHFQNNHAKADRQFCIHL